MVITENKVKNFKKIKQGAQSNEHINMSPSNSTLFLQILKLQMCQRASSAAGAHFQPNYMVSE